MKYAIAALAGLAAAADLSSAAAQEGEGGTLSLLYENDLFSTTDRNYTNGVRAAWITPPAPPSGVAGAFGQLVDEGGAMQVRRGYAIGHSIYTPRDTLAVRPLPDQHPYAAYGYIEYAAIAEQAGRLDRLTVQLGIVGPSAGGEWIQNEVHDIFGDEDVNGWQNQIGDEFGVTVSYDRKLRALVANAGNGVGFDLTPSFGATAGNFRTNAYAGLMARIGSDLGETYGPPRVRPSLAGAGILAPGDGFAWSVFAGVQGRAVAHDIVLDGSFLDEGDPSVDSNTFVGDIQAGFTLQYANAQIAWTYVIRSETFETQDSAQEFGALSFSYRF
ncbi:lipid A deacylase LpxR family protein [Parvularcula oceani]|uniref:lipid A deacylase LpxR family protein n=1 Tax=Parvularcula oceani TaxID=1247963 RepID=UPI00068C5405|nr:lipid A deacylase LpxR family protein [Parvularcula oceani]